MSALFGDIRFSLRSLAAQPGFAAIAVLSLALGIGVNTAIFSALNAVLLRPMPLEDLDRSVIVYHASPARSDRGTSYRAFETYRTRPEIFDDVMATAGSRPLSLTAGDDRVQVYAELVSAGFFRMAHVRLRAGRPWDDEADARGGGDVAVIGHGIWQQRFASDPDIVGRTITLNGRPFEVLGIADAGATGLDVEVAADLWMPIAAWARLMGEPERLTGDEHWLTTVGHLAPGVTMEQAGAAMAIAGRELHQEPTHVTRVRPARERSLAAPTDALAIAGGAFAVGLVVLALACTNIANLLLARAAARQREMSIRAALGGTRWRLMRLWMVESVVLTVTACGVGLIVAWWILEAIVRFRPPVMIGHAAAPALPISFALDVRVAMFAAGLSALTALVIGFVAGHQGARPAVRRFVPGANLRSGIIALQMALASSLLIPGSLFVKSGLAAAQADPGFDASNVLLLPIASDQGGVRVKKPDRFEHEVARRVSLLPGVEAATVMDPVPLWFGGNYAMFAPEGGGSAGSHRVGFSRIGPRYFETMRIPLVAGRDMTAADSEAAPRVAIVNETVARRFWADGRALGRFVRDGDVSLEVIGVARDARYVSLAEAPAPWIYLPVAQEPTDNAALSLAVRTLEPPARIGPAIEREVRALVPHWPAFQFRALDEGLKLQQALPRTGALVLGVLGAFGLLLAAIGIYGVLAYVVRQRTPEIGVRLALGARAQDVVVLVVRQGMAICLAGGLVGVAVSLAASWLLQSVLYGIHALEPVAFVGMPLVLTVIALVACYLPARQAARVNVLEALRGE